MGVSQTVLALLIALISVTGVVVPRIVALFDRPKTDIRAVLFDIESDGEFCDYHVWLTNVGSRPGIVKKTATLTSPSREPLSAVMDDFVILEPGESAVARFSHREDSVASFDGSVLIVDAVSFDSTPAELPVPVSIPDVQP